MITEERLRRKNSRRFRSREISALRTTRLDSDSQISPLFFLRFLSQPHKEKEKVWKSSITLLLTATLLVLHRLLNERPRLKNESLHLRSFPRAEMLVPRDEIRSFDDVGVVEGREEGSVVGLKGFGRDAVFLEEERKRRSAKRFRRDGDSVQGRE